MIKQKSIYQDENGILLKSEKTFRSSVNGISQTVDFLNRSYGMRDSNIEKIILLAYDRYDELTTTMILSIGDRVESQYYNRSLAVFALLSNAFKIAMFHNHPTEELEPSENDLKTKQTAIVTLGILNIEFLGSYIITKNGYMKIGGETCYFEP